MKPAIHAKKHAEGQDAKIPVSNALLKGLARLRLLYPNPSAFCIPMNEKHLVLVRAVSGQSNDAAFISAATQRDCSHISNIDVALGI